MNPLIQTPLTKLQTRFAILDLNGETRIVDREQINFRGNDEVFYYKKTDAELHMSRELELMPVSNPKQVIKDFWINPDTHVYKKIAFHPNEKSPTTLNYWRGNTVLPAKGDWSCIQEFLFEVICASDRLTYEYLISYLAHMLQKPEEKPGVMIVLLGGQGTGKGVFFQLVSHIWSNMTLLISDIDQVLGRFNAALERNFIVCMDEALFAGDRKATDRLKSLVTESSIHIEQKYQPARSIASVHRFFAASNHGHFASVDHDDRRFLILRVSEKYQRNAHYFSKVCASIKDLNVIRAMVYELDQIDLKDFNVRAKPETREHALQKIQSLRGFVRYWFEVLSTGDLSGGRGALNEWHKPRFIATKILVNEYANFDRQAERFQSYQQAQALSILQKVCPSIQRKRELSSVAELSVKEQLRGVLLPELSVARNDFSNYLGCHVEWDEVTSHRQQIGSSTYQYSSHDSPF